MIGVGQLTAFDPAPWEKTADADAASARKLAGQAAQLRVSATLLKLIWVSEAAQKAAAAFDAAALILEGVAEQQDDAAQIITAATREMAIYKKDLDSAIATINGQPVTLADDGTVTVNASVSSQPPQYQAAMCAWASQVTIHVRTILLRAQAAITSREAALAALAAESIPTTTSGPIDLDDESVRLSIDANQQDDYGDCVTLSMLSGKGRADPQWVRDHMKWDPAQKKYVVTIYGTDGKPIEVLVDPAKLPSRGAQAYGSGDPTWMSVMEEAYRQKFPDIVDGSGAAHPDVVTMVTGQTVTRGPGSFDDIRDTLKGPPPGNVIVGTSGATEAQPDTVDPAKRTVVINGGTHAYSVKGFDADGNIVLQNPWGPQGGYIGGKFYPGELHLTQAEFNKWFNTSTRVPGK
jgi:hypothetical protein